VPKLDGQKVTFEDPATLPFSLPTNLEEVTAEWFTKVLRHRGMVPDGVSVTSLTQKGARLTSVSAASPAFCPSMLICPLAA